MRQIPEGVIERLSTYLNCLIKLRQNDVETVSSEQLGSSIGINPAEIRRDFTYFGTFGKKGVGYEVDNLIERIQKILGSDEPHKLALVGAGNLGSAIVQYEGLRHHGFHIAAVFDSDPEKIGSHVANLEIFDIKTLPHIVKKANVNIGVVAVPPAAAQKVTDLLVDGGIKVILNYTPALLRVPDGVQLHNTDPVQQLLHTLFYLSTNSRVLTRRQTTASSAGKGQKSHPRRKTVDRPSVDKKQQAGVI